LTKTKDVRKLHLLSGNLLMKTTPLINDNKPTQKTAIPLYQEKVPKESRQTQHQLPNTEPIQQPPALQDDLQHIVDEFEPKPGEYEYDVGVQMQHVPAVQFDTLDDGGCWEDQLEIKVSICFVLFCVVCFVFVLCCLLLHYMWF
jgi:hypothetical protein